MSSHDESIRAAVRRLVLAGDCAPLRDDEVLLRSWQGRAAAANPRAALPRRLRTLLLLVDGACTVGELRLRLSRLRGLEDGLDMLLRMGLIERLPTSLDL
jgi:hypothetical protein